MGNESKNPIRVIVCRPDECAEIIEIDDTLEATADAKLIELPDTDYVLLSEEDVEKEVRGGKV